MGRNSIPKLGEWRDGKIYRFVVCPDPFNSKEPPPFNIAGGNLISYEMEDSSGNVEVLATAFADGASEVMAAMYQSGFEKGKREGYVHAQADIRKALGVKL